ncbi:hypothetical protein ACQP00_20445 [Dactylosporangium sp. CS-047395]|uniref:hypothetical protein n=1 Tax=Dactylosporangium sp. CS-047395 TaxID=3239936 RepID=UPI003D8A0BE9
MDLVLAESDYRYGAGILRLRIGQIDRGGDGDAWLPVRATQLRGNGSEVGTVHVLVRTAKLRGLD